MGRTLPKRKQKLHRPDAWRVAWKRVPSPVPGPKTYGDVVGDGLKDIGFCPIVWDIPFEELETFQYDNPLAIIQHDRGGSP